MGKVYIVSEGSYSAYCVVGIFTSRELAEKMKSVMREANDIEEFPIDELNPKIAQGYKLYYVECMDRDGNCGQIYLGDGYDYNEVLYNMNNKNYGRGHHNRENEEQYWNFTIWAKDETHAVKIANEYRIQLIETGLWNTKEFAKDVCFD